MNVSLTGEDLVTLALGSVFRIISPRCGSVDSAPPLPVCTRPGSSSPCPLLLIHCLLDLFLSSCLFLLPPVFVSLFVIPWGWIFFSDFCLLFFFFSIFKKFYLFIFYSWVLCIYTCMIERASDAVVDGCEPPCGCWELTSGLPEEQAAVLVTPEPPLQPHWLVFTVNLT